MRKWKISWISDVSGHRVRSTKAFTDKEKANAFAKKQLHPKTKAKLFSVGSRKKSKSLFH